MKRIIPLLVLLLFLVACTAPNRESFKETPQEQASERAAMEKQGMTAEQIEANEKQEFGPRLLGGTVSKYYDWDKTTFDQAVAQNKTIYLEFFASWCPVCNQQEPELLKGFLELNDPNVIGFKIHYKDDQTTDEHVALARQYGIISQHTKIIIKNGKVILKNPEAWDKNRFLTEMKHLG